MTSRLLVIAICAISAACSSAGEAPGAGGGSGGVSGQPGGGGQGGGGAGGGGLGGAGGVHVPGMPTVTQIGTFDSDIFRQWATLVELADGRVLVAGGLIIREPPGGGLGRGTGREEIEIFDVANRTYEEVMPLREGRLGASSVLLPDGTVLIIGGAGGPPGEIRESRDTIERFDPVTNTTTLLPERMGTARAFHGSWLLSSGVHAGKVLIAGGTTVNAPELYDPATGMFTTLGATDAPEGGAGTPILLDDEQLLFIGAPLTLGEDYQGYHRYDPVAGVFSDLGIFTTQARSRYTVTKLLDGRVLVAGGYTTEGLVSLDIFDPSDNSIDPTGQVLDTRRYLHSAAMLPSGRVALISGFSMPGEEGALSTVAIWDPVEETVFDAVGEVSIGRSYSQALTLSSGEIFVIGGQVVLARGNTAIIPNIDIISE
jgi:hypothetical protein